jgi:hypothetical protein
MRTAARLKSVVSVGVMKHWADPISVSMSSSRFSLHDFYDVDFQQVENFRRIWPFFRDRRIDAFEDITSRWKQS